MCEKHITHYIQRYTDDQKLKSRYSKKKDGQSQLKAFTCMNPTLHRGKNSHNNLLINKGIQRIVNYWSPCNLGHSGDSHIVVMDYSKCVTGEHSVWML